MFKKIQNFEIFFENNFPIIKITEKQIEIRPVLRRDSQVEELLKSSYEKSPNAKKIIGDLDNDFYRDMLTLGFYENGILTSTISAKLIQNQKFIETYHNKNEIINEFVNIVLRTLQEAEGQIIEVSRFASKSLKFMKYLYLFLAYYFYCINSTLIKNNERYVLFSNCNSKHNKLYLRLFDSEERISTTQPTIVNGFEHNLNLYMLKEDSKIIKPYYLKLIEKINQNQEKQLAEAA